MWSSSQLWMLRCDFNKKTRLWFLTVKSMSSRSDAFLLLFLPSSHVNLLFVSLAWGFIFRNVMRATVITHVVCSRQREANLSASFSTKVEGTWAAHILDQMHLSICICCEALYDDFFLVLFQKSYYVTKSSFWYLSAIVESFLGLSEAETDQCCFLHQFWLYAYRGTAAET